MKNVRAKQYQTFRLLLYPDCATHVDVMAKLGTGYQYAAILHDKDPVLVDDDSEPEDISVNIDNPQLKKAHWHVVLRFPCKRSPSGVSKELGLPLNYIRGADTYRGACQYLIHFGQPSKYQYPLDDVFGSLVTDVAKFTRSSTEVSRVRKIVDFIDSSGPLDYSIVLRWCLDNNVYGDFRRMGSGVITLINIHNESFHDAHFVPGDKDIARAEWRGYLSGRFDEKHGAEPL